MLPLRGALPVLLLVALTSSAELIPGPERAISRPEYGPAYGTQYPQALATDGTNFLAVWLDGVPGRAGIYAAVVTDTMAVRPSPPQPLVRGNFSVAVATWAGDAYLVAWGDGNVSRTLIARVSREGELLSEPVVVAASSPTAIAWNGRNALLILNDHKFGGPAAVLLDGEGQAVREPIVIPRGAGINSIDVAAAGGVFVIGWSEFAASKATVRMMRVAADGNASAPVDLATALPTYVSTVSLAANGSEVGLAYFRDPDAPFATGWLVMLTIDPLTGVLGPSATARVNAREADVVWTGSGFIASFTGNHGQAGYAIVTVAFSGAVAQPIVVAPAPAADLRLASNGNAVVAIWRDYRLSPPGEYSVMQLSGVALDAGATRTTSSVQPVAISAVAQANPVVAPAGEEALVVWTDLTRTSAGDMVAVRVDAGGNRIGAPVVIAAASNTTGPPVAVFTGKIWLVAWSEHRWLGNSGRGYLMMARVARDGTLLDKTPVEIAEGWGPALASNGSVTVLAFAGLSLVRFTAEGERLDATPLSVTTEGYLPSLATNGREFLVAFTVGSDWWQFPSPNYRDVQAVRLDATGAPMDAAPIDIANSVSDEASPRVVSDGTGYLVAYHLPESVDAKRVLSSGVLDGTTAKQPGIRIAGGTPPMSIAPLRRGYVVVFATDYNLSLVTLDASGTPTAAPRPVATSESYIAGAALASSGAITWLAYGRTAPEPEYANVTRVFVRRLFESSRRRAARP